MVGMTVVLTKTNPLPTLIQKRRRLVLRKPAMFQLAYIKAHGWNDGRFNGNQPCSHPHTGASTVELMVGFAKNNRCPNIVYQNA